MARNAAAAHGTCSDGVEVLCMTQEDAVPHDGKMARYGKKRDRSSWVVSSFIQDNQGC